MSARPVLLATSFALCAAVGLPARPLSMQDCQSGPGSGTWELPSGSGKSDGFISGTLYLDPGHTFRFDFGATLTDVPNPSLTLLTGTIDGSLDDGFGPAPDYLVKGSYSGSVYTGAGTFTAEIRTLTSTVPVGKIEGNFSDAPGSTTPGLFTGNWKICQ